MNKSLNKLQDLIKIKFKNSDLLKNSITHKSYDKKNNYEKLEFIGDRVLGLSISKRLLDWIFLLVFFISLDCIHLV